MDRRQFSRPLDLKQMDITDDFWLRELELVRNNVIPYQWEALNDRVVGADPSYCMHNFRAAGALQRRRRELGDAFEAPKYVYRGFNVLPENPDRPEHDRFYGFVFQDSDFSKWIEAVGYSLTRHPDPELERIADEAIEIVCSAQEPDGYLDTYYILTGMDRAFTDLRNHHELYCLGHLIEGAVSYYRATGKDRLLRAACRFADCVFERFGPEPDRQKGCPGHEIAEMALIRLYEVTSEEKYLRLSVFFLDQRGTDPNSFEEESRRNAEREGKIRKPDPDSLTYLQAHKPVREQDEAVGHAVRAGYLYSGMADAARLTGDEALFAACRRLWDSIVNEKLYITGGVGGTCHGEAFSYPYDLPNDSAYSETCAAIALVFFARRMLQIEPKAEYADVMELALYNTVLAGMALDGRSFFYVNPLAVDPEACRRDKRLEHVQPRRRKWFGCACCPPNIARLLSSVSAYACTENEDTLWLHLFIGGTIRKTVGSRVLQLQVQTDMPRNGNLRLTVTGKAPVDCTVAIRIPGWSGAPVIHAPEHAARELRDGYVYLTACWQQGDVVSLELPMQARMVAASPKVRENAGKAAFLRGPITYCAEEADNGPALHLWHTARALTESIRTEETAIEGIPLQALLVPADRELPGAGGLYRDYRAPETEPGTLKLIPYFAWANRSEGEMAVWLNV